MRRKLSTDVGHVALAMVLGIPGLMCGGCLLLGVSNFQYAVEQAAADRLAAINYKPPNEQQHAAFIGELTSQLLSAQSLYPV